RGAAIEALSSFGKEKGVLDALRRALNHGEPSTRARAGQALAHRTSGAMAMPLIAALEVEKDPAAWEGLAAAIAAINSQEATGALARIAFAHRGLFSFGGGLLRRQLAVVRALAGAGTPAARHALEKIVAEADGDVKREAEAALKG